MPIHPSYNDFIANLKKTYGDRWEQVFHALCQKYGWNHEEPMPKPGEDFSWIVPLRYSSRDEMLYIHGTAIRVGKTGNQNVYTRDELIRAARTLVDKPIGYDHPASNRIVGKVTDAEFVDDHVEYVGLIEDPEVERLIRDGEVGWVSIEATYRSEVIVDGLEPHGLVFTGLALIPPGAIPGDPGSSVHVWERLLSWVNFEGELREKMREERPEGEHDIEEDQRRKGEPKSERERLISHLEAHARELGIGEYAGEKMREIAADVKALREATAEERIKKIVKEGLLEDMYPRLMDLEQRVKAIEDATKPPEQPPLTEDVSKPPKLPRPPEVGADPTERPTLTEEMDSPPARPMGRALTGDEIPEMPPQEPSDLISKKEILSLLPERVPLQAGWYAHELVRRIRDRLK